MQLDNILKGSYQRYTASDFLATQFFNKRIPLVIDNIDNVDIDEIKSHLIDCYGDISVVVESDDSECELLISDIKENIDTIILPSVALTDCKRFDFSDLERIMNRLRADDGCEWDRAQTHESIRINVIEEAYELVEGIDFDNVEMIKEECGDILMQAVFHAEIAKKNKEFNYIDMITGLCRKLIDRHTHIFGINHANNADEALVFWDEAKKKEKKYKSNSDAMDRVPKNLPALLYAEKLQKIAKKCGFDWDGVQGALDKVVEESKELVEALPKDRVEEAGDLLFAVVNVLRFYKIDPEMALHDANLKFYRRFSAVEKEVLASGRQMQDCTLEELDGIWNKVKEQERKA